MPSIPFMPDDNPSKTLAVSNVSARQFIGVSVGLVMTGNALRLYNSAGVDMFLEFGDITVVATVATGIPLPTGFAEVFTVPPGATHYAAITAAGAGNLYSTVGGGF